MVATFRRLSGIPLQALFVLGWVVVTCAQTNTPPADRAGGAEITRILYSQILPDPVEPVNRAFWSVNKGVMTGVVKPTAKVYRWVVRPPVRRGISNFGRNATYPGRFINNVLEGKWKGAGDETERFLCNTVLGLAGFFDVASKWNIPKSDADFGQTFGQWGWKPHAFVMLPIYGPSTPRDTLGLAVDTAADPLTYLSPYNIHWDNPLTYVSPRAYVSDAVMYNNLSDSVDSYVRFSRTEMDPYSEISYAWGFVRQGRVVNFQPKGQPDEATLETLQSVFFTFRDPQFPSRGQTKSVLIPATGKRLKFTAWLQPGKAPVVYIVPGLGSHRLAETALALAELLYSNGFSVVTVSNPFNYEFMESASTTPLPAYAPVDAHDLHVALTQIDRRLEQLRPGRQGRKALLGYSMGAFEALRIAAGETNRSERLLSFDRYVAINTPVRLLYGISKLDEFYAAPLAWPPQERAQDIDNTLLKVATLTQSSLTPNTTLPFSGVESKFLIGVNFRLILRDVIYTSQRRHNQHVLERSLDSLRRRPVYREILQYSYEDYFEKFVIPYYLNQGIDLRAGDALEQASSLRTFTTSLHDNPNVRLLANENDFLIDSADLDWLRSTFPPDRLKLFPRGGHLGNLASPAVKSAILEALQKLQPQIRPK